MGGEDSCLPPLCCSHCQYVRPVARGLGPTRRPAQFSWRTEARQAWFVLWWTVRGVCLDGPGTCTACISRSCSAASLWHFQLLVYSKCIPPTVITEIMHGRPGQYFTWPMPSPWSWLSLGGVLYRCFLSHMGLASSQKWCGRVGLGGVLFPP